MSKILATSVGLALSLGLVLPIQTATAAADTTLTMTRQGPFASYGDGVWYRNFVVIKTSNKIKLVDQFDFELLTFTIPTPVSVSEFTAYRVGFDAATGRLFYGTGFNPMKLWYLDVDLLIDNWNKPEVLSTIQPVQIFEGLGTECRASAGGIAFRPASSPRPEELYFGCPSSQDVAKNKLYKVSIPSSGVLTSAAVVANGSHLYSFRDLEYRSQDDMLFAVMRNGEGGEQSYIAKINPSGTLPVAPVTLLTSTLELGMGGITGIDLDASGSIFYTTYQNLVTPFSGHQLTQEAPVAVSEGLYKYPTGSTDYIYSHDLILVAGSQATAGVVGYQTNGHGGLIKITGTPASSASTIPSTVTFNANDGTAGLVIQESSVPASLNLNTFIRPGYTFTGWNEAAIGNSTPFVDGASYSFNANLTLYAQWSLNTYNLTFDSQSGSAVTATTFDVENSVAAPSAPTRNGYTFAGWATTPSGTAVTFPYNPAAADLTLYAKWSPIVYSLTFDTQGGSAVAPSIFDLDAPVPQPQTPSRSGYTFTGWATTTSGAPILFPYTASAGNLTLYAQWSLNTYNLTFDSQSGSAVTATTFDVENSVAAPSAPTRNGYTFAGWATTPSGTAVTFPYNPAAADLTLYALWQNAGLSPSAPTTSPVPVVSELYETPGSDEGHSLVGLRLADVEKIFIGGIEVTLVAKSDTLITIVGLEGFAPGNYDVELFGPFGRLIVQGLFQRTFIDPGPTGSTKLLDDGILKVRVFNAASGEKIQVFQNGKELAWVRTENPRHPKLHKGYLVRTVVLRPGKNVFEFFVDGERIRRNAYAGY